MSNFQSLTELNPPPSLESCSSWFGHKSEEWIGLGEARLGSEWKNQKSKRDFPLYCLSHEPRDRHPPLSFCLCKPPWEHLSSGCWYETVQMLINWHLPVFLTCIHGHARMRTHTLNFFTVTLQTQIPCLPNGWKKWMKPLIFLSYHTHCLT